MISTFQRLCWAWGSLSDRTDVGPAPTRLLGLFLGPKTREGGPGSSESCKNWNSRILGSLVFRGQGSLCGAAVKEDTHVKRSCLV